ncbi:MAG TPA: glycoside hydrolase family 3 C-terminal domain-containing protein [Thermoguttaceae bacterium]
MKTAAITSIFFGFLTLCIASGHAQDQYPFQNPDLSIEERIDNIVSLMTLEEKIACLSTRPNVSRLGIKGTGHVEGLHGLAMGGPGGWGRPSIVPTTTFPQAIGMAETWDPEIIHQAAAIEGYEVRFMVQCEKYKRGGLVVRAPNADLGRDPRWGRTEECYGEDPFFNGTMVVAFVKGLQGDDPKYWQAASLMKHFLANSNEDNRGSSSSNFDERLLREYYSVPFRMGVIEGGSRAYMAAYNAVNGIPCTVQPILKNITIKEWGQNGIICTDGGGLRLLVSEHKYYPDLEQAAAGSVKAGINQFLDRFREPVTEAVKKNLLTEADIDKVIKGNFRVMIKLGLLDPPDKVPYAEIGVKKTVEPWTTDKHKAVARLVTQKSIVLLKNKNNFLPLNKDALKSIAVIGPRADEVFLDWYSGTPPYTVTPLDGIKKKVVPGRMVIYAYNNENDAAVNAAKMSDVAIVCVGNHPTGNAPWEKVTLPSYGKEAVDRQSITLEDEELIKQVYAANPRTVVVLICSFPYAINWTQENVSAILHMTHNSQEEGNALADVLFGDYNPAGRLVQTWPKSLDQIPPMMDYNIRDGRTYMYLKCEPLYPFGYGLSYTSFEYSNLKISSSSLAANGSITVSVDVKNTGDRAGEEVVQMYVKHLNSTVERPIKELKGFERISLEPGETKTVDMTLKADQLAYWDANKNSWVVENDKIQIMIGASSADIKLDSSIDVISHPESAEGGKDLSGRQ